MDDFVLPSKQPVVMSEPAIAHFSSIAEGKIVKFGVEGGGCAGFQYSWNIIDNADELYSDDVVILYDKFTFAIDGQSLMFLTGSSVDYLTDITGSRIEVNNPLANAGCGCGVSVSF